MAKKPAKDRTKLCPQCFCNMKLTHPRRTEPSKTYPEGRVIEYRRWTCECGHYESAQSKTMSRGSLTAVEIDELENKKANRFYPKTQRGFAHQRRNNQ